ncbi:MAG: hypothetical protein ACE5D3_01090 [Candidatus Binatia bacterium]
MMQNYRSATTDSDIVSMAVHYFKLFPESEVSTHCFLRYLKGGGAVDWKTGALFHPGFAKPDPEQNVAQEDVAEDIRGTVNAGELIDAGIGFDMRENESSFTQEWVEHGEFKLAVDGELRGVRTHESNDTEMKLLEPFTEVEAVVFVGKLFVCPANYKDTDGVFDQAAWWAAATEAIEHRNEQLLKNLNTKRARIQRMLAEAVERFEDRLLWAQQHNAEQRHRNKRNFVSAFALHDVNADEWRRARASDRRYNVGGHWSQESIWFIGEREGITHGREELNDQLHNRLDQDHLPGEKQDGQGLLHEEEGRESLDKAAAYYRRTSRVRPSAIFEQCYTHYKKQYNPQIGRREMVFVQAADGGPVNRGWTDRSVYLLRQELRRGEYFAEKLWRILTWPLEVLEQGFPGIEAAYINSIKAAAPGPGRKSEQWLTEHERADINKLGWYKPGNWHNVPVYGAKAIAWLKSRTDLGRLAGQYVHKDIRVITGESWHKTVLRREQLDALRDAIEWRRQQDGYQGLPLNYVAAKYG